MIDALLRFFTPTPIIAGIETAVYVVVYALVAAVAVSSYVQARKAAKLASQQSSQTRSRGTLAQIRAAVVPRRLIYGRHRVGGIEAFVTVHGDENQFIDYILIWADGPCEEVEGLMLDSHRVDLVPIDDENPWILVASPTDFYAGNVRFESELGNPNIVPHGTGIIPKWGDVGTNLLHGICYSWLELKYDPEKFQAGVPNITALIKGRNDIWDPRESVVKYTNNPALCSNHYMTLQKLGPGLTYATEIAENELIAAANVCEEIVSVPRRNFDSTGGIAEGGTSPNSSIDYEFRYTFDGIINLDSSGEDIIEQFMMSMAGTRVYIGGKWRIYAGAYQAPTFTVDKNIIVGPVSMSSRPSKRDRFNCVRGVYVDEFTKWVPTDFPAVKDPTFIEQDGEELSTDVDLLNSGSPYRARRLGSIVLRSSRFGREVKVPCNIEGWRAQSGRTVTFDFPELGFNNTPMDVTAIDFVIEERKIRIDVSLRETDPSIFDEPENEPYPVPDSMPPLPKPPKDPGDYTDILPKLPINVEATAAVRGGLLSLCGFAEFANISSPPKVYRKKHTQGGMLLQRFMQSLECEEDPCSKGEGSAAGTGLMHSSGYGPFGGGVGVTEISRVEGVSATFVGTAYVLWGDGTPGPAGTPIIAGPGIPFGVNAYSPVTLPWGSTYHATVWFNYIVWGVLIGIDVCFTVGVPKKTIDDWDVKQEYDANCTLGTVENNSTRNYPETDQTVPLTGIEDGRADTFYLSAGMSFSFPAIALEPTLVDVEVTSTSRRTTGRDCQQNTSDRIMLGGPGSTRSVGTVTEQLSNEDTEEAAILRMRAAQPYPDQEDCGGGPPPASWPLIFPGGFPCGASFYERRVSGTSFLYAESVVQFRIESGLVANKSYMVRVPIDMVDLSTGSVMLNAAYIDWNIAPNQIALGGSTSEVYDVPVRKGYSYRIAPVARRQVMGLPTTAEEEETGYVAPAPLTEEAAAERTAELAGVNANEHRPSDIPLSGTDQFRLEAQAGGLILDNEIHSTSDQHRLFLEGYLVGPVWHGNVLNEEAMLALTTNPTDDPYFRGVFAMDMCYREDVEAVFMCISDRGQTIDNWIAMGANLNLDAILDGGNGSGSNIAGEDELDGGDAGDEFDDIVDGTPEEEAL